MTQPASATYPVQGAPPRNGLGTASMVLGIIGLCLAVLPIIGVIAWPLVILGLIYGNIGIIRAGKGTATNRGSAIAGTVTSGIGLLACIAWAASVGAAVNGLPHDIAEGQSQAQPQTPTRPSMPGADSAPVKLAFGETHVWPGGEEITISAPTEFTETNPYLDQGNRYVSFDVTVINNGTTEYNAGDARITVQHDGRPSQPHFGADNPMPDVQLPRGEKTTFTRVFEVGQQSGELRVSIAPNSLATDTVYFTGQF